MTSEIEIISDGRYCGIIEYSQVAFRCNPNDLKEVPPDCLACKMESCDLECGIKHSPKQKEIQIVILRDLSTLTREERLTILKQTIIQKGR